MERTDIEEWIKRQAKKPALKGIENKKNYLSRLIDISNQRCKWTGLPLRFDLQSARPPTDPLYAEIDHREAGSNKEGHDLVCHRLNDVKAQIPWRLWLALTRTPEFNDWISALRNEYNISGTLKQPKSLQNK